MAAALVSIGTRVGTSLNSGIPKNIVIEGRGKTVFVRSIGKSSMIATAPPDAKIGLVDFKMDKVSADILSIL